MSLVVHPPTFANKGQTNVGPTGLQQLPYWSPQKISSVFSSNRRHPPKQMAAIKHRHTPWLKEFHKGSTHLLDTLLRWHLRRQRGCPFTGVHPRHGTQPVAAAPGIHTPSPSTSRMNRHSSSKHHLPSCTAREKTQTYMNHPAATRAPPRRLFIHQFPCVPWIATTGAPPRCLFVHRFPCIL
jgi:hypothetical protein